MKTARRMWALHGANIILDLGLLVPGQHGSLTVPVPAFLIEHDRGLVLFDTGISPEAWEDPHATYGSLMETLQLETPAENKLDRQLAHAGFKPEDVTHVVVSHSHMDHTGGLFMFPQAQFYMSVEDLRYAYWPDAPYHGFFRTVDLDRTRSFSWNLVRSDVDLFADGSIQLLRTPGHTPGELSLLVKLPSRTLVLTGDAVHLRSSMEAGCPCPIDMDASAAIRSIDRLKHTRTSHQADIWVMHDPVDWQTFDAGSGKIYT